MTPARPSKLSSQYPDFDDPAFLTAHVEDVLGFYRGRAIDPKGGLFHTYTDDGQVYDPGNRHLVSSCRFVVSFSVSFVRTGNEGDRKFAQHGLDYLRATHQRKDGSFAWELRDGVVSDPRGMAYGHAFVLLAASRALQAGLNGARALLDRVWSVLEGAFWEPSQNAYCDEFAEGLQGKSAYRGQNSNMHMTEACLAAWEATEDARFLDRAKILIQRFTCELAREEDGLIWEHFTEDWAPDFDFNFEKPDDLFRPWGFQPGHQVEWARLLLILHEHRPNSAYVARAKALYQHGLTLGKDTEFGGIYYGFAPDGSPCSHMKYYWVHSETIATAWRLFQLTGDVTYREDYFELWRYCWDNFVDHDHGAWFRWLTREGQKVDALKSPPGKTDYHTVGVIWDILSAPNGVNPD